jgi:hypothetical protein
MMKTIEDWRTGQKAHHGRGSFEESRGSGYCLESLLSHHRSSVRRINGWRDSAYVRRALCSIFKCESDFEVCGEAVNGREAIAKAQELHPDLIVLDLSMPVKTIVVRMTLAWSHDISWLGLLEWGARDERKE